MSEAGAGAPAPRARRGGPVVITGLAALSAFGRGGQPLLAAALAGRAAFAPVQRFDVGDRRVRVAATLPGDPDLLTELTGTVEAACSEAGLDPSERAACPLLLAVHGDPGLARADRAEQPTRSADALAEAVAAKSGLARDRKSTRLNSSHVAISYAVFC